MGWLLFFSTCFEHLHLFFKCTSCNKAVPSIWIGFCCAYWFYHLRNRFFAKDWVSTCVVLMMRFSGRTGQKTAEYCVLRNSLRSNEWRIRTWKLENSFQFPSKHRAKGVRACVEVSILRWIWWSGLCTVLLLRGAGLSDLFFRKQISFWDVRIYNLIRMILAHAIRIEIHIYISGPLVRSLITLVSAHRNRSLEAMFILERLLNHRNCQERFSSWQAVLPELIEFRPLQTLKSQIALGHSICEPFRTTSLHGVTCCSHTDSISDIMITPTFL